MNPLRQSCRAITASSSLSTNILQARLPVRSFSTSLILSAPKSPVNKSAKDASAKAKSKRRKKRHPTYKLPVKADLKQFTLCDAMRFIQAFEAGRDPSVPKYDLAVRLKTKRDGPVLRNQVKLPYSVKTDIRVCVLADPNSKAGKQAKEAGAVLVGLEEVFDKVKNGKIDFDRCITIPENLPMLNKEGLPRILGPRGLMPSVKLGTVTENVGPAVKNLLGGSTYRERQGVIRLAIGQLGFTPEQLRENVKAFIGQIRKEGSQMAEQQNFFKEVYEVVLSSTNSPGFSLNGEFKSADSPSTQQLAATA